MSVKQNLFVFVHKCLMTLNDVEYNNNVHFEGVRFICGPHLAIIGPSEARADLMAR